MTNRKKIFSTVINQSLEKMLEFEPRLVVLGEDIMDPYGGAFGVTKGLSLKFPDRIVNTPISEAGVFGFSFGMASEGVPVIMEIMFGDFALLILDQLHNNASKISAMSHTKSKFIVRTPMGGYRGYGPTHSQSLHRFLVGSINVEVVSSSNFIEPLQEFRTMFSRGNITIYIEDKSTYSNIDHSLSNEFEKLFSVHRLGFPYQDVLFKSLLSSNVSSTLVICVGSTLRIALEAARKLLIENEVVVDVYQVNSLWPLNTQDLKTAVNHRTTVVLIEECWVVYGIASEILAGLAEHKSITKETNVVRIGAESSIIPASFEEENKVLPTASKLVETILNLKRGARN